MLYLSFFNHGVHYYSKSFPPRMWNHFQNSGPKTNNHLEGWHYRLNRLARKAHPNLIEIIELIKNEQASTEVQMIQVAAGGQPRPKKRKAVRQDHKFLDEMLLQEPSSVIVYLVSRARLLCGEKKDWSNSHSLFISSRVAI